MISLLTLRKGNRTVLVATKALRGTQPNRTEWERIRSYNPKVDGGWVVVEHTKVED